MPTVGHFKLTFDSSNKFNEVTQSRPHPPNTNRKYDLLQELLQVMDDQSASFLSERATRFETTDQFLQTGLMKWGNWLIRLGPLFCFGLVKCLPGSLKTQAALRFYRT